MNDGLRIGGVDVTSPTMLGDVRALDGAATLGPLGPDAARREPLHLAMGVCDKRDERPAGDEIARRSPASATVRLIAQANPRRAPSFDRMEIPLAGLGCFAELTVQDRLVGRDGPTSPDVGTASALVAQLLDQRLVEAVVADGCASLADLGGWWRREIAAATGELGGPVTNVPWLGDPCASKPIGGSMSGCAWATLAWQRDCSEGACLTGT